MGKQGEGLTCNPETPSSSPGLTANWFFFGGPKFTLTPAWPFL